MNTVTEVSAAHRPSSDEVLGQRGFALALVISLFFAWGLTYGLLDVLNKHFQQALSVSRMESALLQTCYFGAYFLVAVPAGLFVNRYGYRRGILLGLALFSIGALLFVPATGWGRFGPFLFALFVLASGAACLETAANPYVTLLGARDSGAYRLNLAQAFTGLGAFIGPIIGGVFFFRHGTSFAGNAVPVKFTYVAIAVVMVLIGVAFALAKFPGVQADKDVAEHACEQKPLWRKVQFVSSIAAQFFYFSAQVGIAAFFINYATEHWPGLPVHSAAFMLSAGMASFTIGRFASTGLMRKVDPAKLLTLYAVACIALCLIVVAGLPTVSVVALIAVFFFESIMFPTIFALGVRDLGSRTGRAASLQVMSLSGGAIAPLAMGALADRTSIAAAYLIPAGCFAAVLAFSISCWGRREP